MENETINNAVAAILTQPKLPNHLRSRAFRFNKGKMGLASKLSLLESEGYEIEINIKPPKNRRYYPIW